MDGNRFVVTWHVHGTLAADVVIRYKLPCAATLVRVDTCGTADAEGALVIGTVGDTDGYVKTYTPGHNATFSVKDRGDFDGALNSDTNECPHLAKDTELLLTWTHDDGNTDTDIALTFLEG